MRELWRLLIAAREQGIDPDQLFFAAEGYSPYYQLALGSFNSERVAEYRNQKIAVNPYIRYDRVFDDLLRFGVEEHKHFIALLTDVLLHVLGGVDVLEGLYKSELEINLIAENLQSGVYGELPLDSSFSRHEYKIIANFLLLFYRTGEYIHCFMKALSSLFAYSYAERRDTGELMIFLGRAKTQKLERKVHYLISLFLHVDSAYSVYWDQTPGVIGYDETMVLEDFLLA